jgi:peptide/nickel transport system permease protein
MTLKSAKALGAQLFKDWPTSLSALLLMGLYALIVFADVIAPYSVQWANRQASNAPPTGIYLRHPTTGQLTWPYVLKETTTFDPQQLVQRTRLNASTLYPLCLWVKGEPYKLFGFIPGDRHLFGVDAPAGSQVAVHLLGTDINGRDIFSRMLFGGRISLTIGFFSLLVAFPIGLLVGGIAGYAGGWVDTLLMRVCEIVMSIPTLYLLISLAAILPAGLSPTERFAMVTVILALVSWAGLARVIRGLVLSIRQQEFVEAVEALGLPPFKILVRHVLPQTASYVLVAATLGVPGYLLAESALSFLGLGITQPDASWGNMLKEAQNLTNLLNAPWMMAPGLLIFLAVLCFNMIGDAVRDHLDPKQRFRQLQ